MRFRDRVALVTGGASGIGKASAARLAAEGCRVAVLDLRKASDADLALTGDVSVESDVRDAVAATVEAFGRLDVLHSNAAVLSREVYGRDQDLLDMDVEVWDRTMAVNLRGAMLCVKHSVPAMTAGGSIVFTASVSGLLGDTDHAAYGAAKAALMSLTRYVATMYGGRGIRCNAVAPGLVLTEVARAVMGPERLAEKAAERVLPDPCEPEDVAALVAFLASAEARCVTGQTIVIDSGTTAHRPEHAIRQARLS